MPYLYYPPPPRRGRGRGGRGGGPPRPRPYTPHPHHGATGESQGRVRCYECNKFVSDLRQHKAQAHAPRYFGFQCPQCAHFEPESKRNLMVRHLTLHGPGAPSIEQCAKHFPEGYQRAELCREAGCHFKAPSSFNLGIHVAMTHSQGALAAVRPPHVFRPIARSVVTPVLNMAQLNLASPSGSGAFVLPQRSAVATPSQENTPPPPPPPQQ